MLEEKEKSGHLFIHRIKTDMEQRDVALWGGLYHGDRSWCQTGVPCLMRVGAKDGGKVTEVQTSV